MSKGVRLPMPFSPATSSVASGTTTASATTASLFSRLMPRTPAAGRPMERTSSSAKRMLMPSRVMRTTWSCPAVSFTSISVSPGSMPMAMMPPLRTLAKVLERGLLHRALLGGEEQEARLLPGDVFLVRPGLGLDADQRGNASRPPSIRAGWRCCGLWRRGPCRESHARARHRRARCS